MALAWCRCLSLKEGQVAILTSDRVLRRVINALPENTAGHANLAMLLLWCRIRMTTEQISRLEVSGVFEHPLGYTLMVPGFGDVKDMSFSIRFRREERVCTVHAMWKWLDVREREDWDGIRQRFVGNLGPFDTPNVFVNIAGQQLGADLVQARISDSFGRANLRVEEFLRQLAEEGNELTLK